MTYFKDLTFFRYSDATWAFNEGIPYIFLNIGWLDSEHPYTTGEPREKDLLTYVLSRHCEFPVNMCRGTHRCHFCQFPPDCYKAVPEPLMHHGKQINVGNGEIFIRGMNNLVYVAPTMIYHYIRDHNYNPPEEFVDAVLVDKPYDHFYKLYNASY